MSLPANFTGWSIKCVAGTNVGLEQSVADWGIEHVVINRRPTAMETMTCSSIVEDATVPVFFYGDTAALYYTAPGGARTRWFMGVWTKPQGSLSGTSESTEYELSGSPWWYLSRTAMQDTTLAVTPSSPGTPAEALSPLLTWGGAVTNVSTTVSGVLAWCLHCGAIQSTGAVVPFTIGTVAINSMFVPQEQVTNVTAAAFLQHILRWSPDCAVTVDYSEPTPGAPATLNVLARSQAPAVNLPLTGGAMTALSRITPRHDLVPTGVVIVYETTTTINGQNYVSQGLDAYPVGTLPTDFGVMVPYVNLQGGSETIQTQDVTTAPLPQVGLAGAGSAAGAWFQNHCEWLFGTASAPTKLDTANVSVFSVLGKDLWNKDPYATGAAPAGFSISGMVNELVAGAVTKWMTDEQDIFGAYVVLSFLLIYSGSDPTTKALFQTIEADGSHSRTEYVRVKATNAGTETYSHVASASYGETAPIGLAQAMYLARNQVHYEGSVELTEQECSGSVQMKNAVNITGGAAAWATMAAQIVSITESLAEGKTTISFGPPQVLGIDELVDLVRCTRVRQQPFNADQQSTGESGSSSNVIGHTHSPHSSTSSPPGGGSSAPLKPWDLSFQTDPANPGAWEVACNPKSVLLNTDNSQITVTLADGVFAGISPSYTQCWIEATVSDLGTVSPVTLVYGSAADFNFYGAFWSSNGPTEGSGSPLAQTLWRKPIATIVWSSGPNPTPTATNLVGANLTVFNVALNGLPGVYPY